MKKVIEKNGCLAFQLLSSEQIHCGLISTESFVFIFSRGVPDNPALDRRFFKNLVPAGFVLKIGLSTGFS